MTRTAAAFFLATLCLIGASCARAQSVIGVWENWELYKNWSNGIVDELVQPRDIVVDDVTYVGFTDSIIISKDSLSVPGGKWRIAGSKQDGPGRTDLQLTARKDPSATGTVTVNFLTADSIYFTTKRMDEAFRKEFEQSFLILGKENYLVRCKRK